MIDKRATLHWNLRDSKRQYYELNDIDLNHKQFNNLNCVYVIWYRQAGSNTTVYTGQAKNGLIKNRLSDHRSNPRIQLYARKAPLYIAWAKALTYEMNGIERYLHDRLKPLVKNRSLTATANPITVNLPWD